MEHHLIVLSHQQLQMEHHLKLRSHKRGAVAERRRADFDIPAALPRVCSHIRGADAGGSAISWGQWWFGARGFEAGAVNWVLDPFLAERFLLPLRLRSATAHVWTYLNSAQSSAAADGTSPNSAQSSAAADGTSPNSAQSLAAADGTSPNSVQSSTADGTSPNSAHQQAQHWQHQTS